MQYLPLWKYKICHIWKKEKKYIWIAFMVGIACCVWYGMTQTKSYAAQIQQGVSAKVVRFHVLANSDDDKDQALKLDVRDKVLAVFGEKLAKCQSKAETLALLQNSQTEICRIATEEVQRQGYDYAVSVCLVQEQFPQKQYGDLVFPAGMYDALRIEIGAAEGHNWWCVLYPQMCYVDAAWSQPTQESHIRLENALTKEEFLVISAMEQQKTMPKIKLKVVELWQNAAS